jgi:hypothetical protein
MKKYVWIEIHPGYQNLILNRIKESNRSYSKAEQRAELLMRNEKFIAEWRFIEGPESENALVDWGAFCARWGIRHTWNGWPPTLAAHIRTSPGLLYHPLIFGTEQGIKWDELVPFPDTGDRSPYNRPDYLLVQIDPWTSSDDVKKLWPRIEKLKKQIFGYSEKDKWNFGEALCWYDLRTNYRYSFGKIALLWQMEKAPHEHEDDIKTRVRLGIKRISSYIQRLTPLVELINVKQPKE